MNATLFLAALLAPSLALADATGFRPLAGRPSSAAAEALGNAAGMLAGADGSLEAAPSSLAEPSQSRFGLQYGRFSDIQQSSLSLLLPRENWGLGFSLDASDFGAIQNTDSYGNRLAEIRPLAFGMAAGAGFRRRSLGYGLALRQGLFISNGQTSPAGSSSAGYSLGLDVGFQWRGRRAMASLNVLDIGIYRLKLYNGGDGLAASGNVWDTRSLLGFGWHGLGGNKLRFSQANILEINYGAVNSGTFGLEAALFEQALIRGALRYQYLNGSLEPSFRWGLGWRGESWELDYAYQPVLPGAVRHRIGLARRWGAASSKPPAAASAAVAPQASAAATPTPAYLPVPQAAAEAPQSASPSASAILVQPEISRQAAATPQAAAPIVPLPINPNPQSVPQAQPTVQATPQAQWPPRVGGPGQ